jgi:hypothetical protein
LYHQSERNDKFTLKINKYYFQTTQALFSNDLNFYKMKNLIFTISFLMTATSMMAQNADSVFTKKVPNKFKISKKGKNVSLTASVNLFHRKLAVNIGSKTKADSSNALFGSVMVGDKKTNITAGGTIPLMFQSDSKASSPTFSVTGHYKLSKYGMLITDQFTFLKPNTHGTVLSLNTNYASKQLAVDLGSPNILSTAKQQFVLNKSADKPFSLLLSSNDSLVVKSTTELR